MQKTIAFYHEIGLDMLKLGCYLTNLANICVQKATDTNFYPVMEAEKDLLDKVREDVIGGPSIVLHEKQFLIKLSFEIL